MKLLKDHPATIEFALQSGKLIHNFGLVELTSYRWIDVLSGSPIATEISKEVPLTKRIDIILKLLSRDTMLAPDARRKATKLWKDLREKGCELRNTIAHGTVGFAGNDPSQSIGILKLRKWQDTDELMSLEELTNAVNATARIAVELNEILESARS